MPFTLDSNSAILQKNARPGLEKGRTQALFSRQEVVAPDAREPSKRYRISDDGHCRASVTLTDVKTGNNKMTNLRGKTNKTATDFLKDSPYGSTSKHIRG